MNSGTDAVQCGLAHTNGHTASTLVTDAENGFVVRHHHQLYVSEWCGLTQNFFNAPGVLRCDKHAASASEHSRIVTRRFAHCRRIDNRHHFFDVLTEQFVKQHFIAVLKHCETNIPAYIVTVVKNGLEDSLGLGIDIVVLGRQQTLNTQFAALGVSERSTFVV